MYFSFNLCFCFAYFHVGTSNYILMQKPANAPSKVPPPWQIWKRSSIDTFLANMANVHCNTLVANMAFPCSINADAGLRLCPLCIIVNLEIMPQWRCRCHQMNMCQTVAKKCQIFADYSVEDDDMTYCVQYVGGCRRWRRG